MSLPPYRPVKPHVKLPPAYGGCTCACHSTPGMMHIVACCHPVPAKVLVRNNNEYTAQTKDSD